MGTPGCKGGCMVLPLKAVGIICPKCDDIIFSRAHHDYHSCTCEAISIDGGFDYLRFSFANDIRIEDIIRAEIVFDESITKQLLYDDWNRRQGEFGIINIENGGYGYVCEINCGSEQTGA